MQYKNKLIRKLLILSIFSSVIIIAWKQIDYKNSLDNLDINLKYGTPFSTFYPYTIVEEDEISEIIEDTLGTIFLAGKLGIIEFDSYEQKMIYTDGQPLNLYLAKSGKIYVVCNNSFGEILNTDTGYIYSPLYEFTERNTIENSQIIEFKDKIYFHQNNIVGIFYQNNSKFSVFGIPDNNNMDNICIINKKLYYYSSFLGYSEVVDSTITENFLEFSEGLSAFTVPISEDSTYILTNNNKIYLYSNSKFTKIDENRYSYLKEKLIRGIKKVGNNLAFYTLNGGIILYNYKKNQISTVMDMFSGLPDNQVYAMNFDHNNGMWIANKKGIYRYDFHIPVKEYSSYVGLEGDIITTAYANKTLYIFTNKGVFYLTRPRDMKEVSMFRKYDNSQDITTILVSKDKPKEETTTTNTNVIKKWKQKLFKKNKKENTEYVPPKNTSVISVTTNKNVKKYVLKNKLNQNLEFIKYYKKLELINSKTTAVKTIGNKIYVATTSGLFLIENKKVKQIIEDEYITNIFWSEDGYLLVAGISGLYVVNDDDDNNEEFNKVVDIEKFNSFVYSITEDTSNFWLGTKGSIYKLKKDFSNFTSYQIDPNYLQEIVVINIAKTIYAYTTFGVFKYYDDLDKFEKYKTFKSNSGPTNFIKSENNVVWYKSDNKWYIQSDENEVDSSQMFYLPLINNIRDIKYFIDFLWVTTSDNKIYKIDKGELLNYEQNLGFKRILIGNNIYKTDNINIAYKDNLVAKIEIAAPYYIKPNSLIFEHATSMNNKGKLNWISHKSNNFDVNLNVGTQYIYFRSKDIFGRYSDIQEIKITVKPPFYQERWFSISVIVLSIILILIVAYLRQRALRRKNEMLEKIVLERTAEIRSKNEELISQKEEISQQNVLLKEQKDQISKSHLYITQSINYASRIQNAILPLETMISDFFGQYFILYLPRDVVSGDFYWFKDTGEKLFVIVSDCTGHGVPGAFLSMLGSAYLNEIISIYKNLNAGEYLSLLRINILNSLKEKEDKKVRDGMDMAFCIIDKKTKKLNFAGAKQNYQYIRNGELNIIKGDKMPIGHYKNTEAPFTEHYVQLEKDDIIYLFSDGYADQLGGEHYRKMQITKFKEILPDIANKELAEQKEILIEVHKKWKGDFEQTDDITVIGLKV